MGFASYFEDIGRSQAEYEQSRSAFVSTAGAPPSCSGGTVPRLASALSAVYSRLRPLCFQIRSQIRPEDLEGYKTLSTRMDQVAEKVKLFRNAQFADKGTLYKEATAQAEEIEGFDATLSEAKQLRRNLTPLAHGISVELGEIERLLEGAKEAGQSDIPGRDPDLERPARLFRRGYKSLTEQTKHIEQRPDDLDDLKVELGDDVFRRVMANRWMEVQDKDVYPE